MGLVSLQIVLSLILGINSFKILLQDYTQSIGTIPTYLTSSSFSVKVEEKSQQPGQKIAFRLFDSQLNTLSGFQGQSFCLTNEKGGCLIEKLSIAAPGSYYLEAYTEFSQVKSEIFYVMELGGDMKTVNLEEGSGLIGFYLEFISVTPSVSSI